MKRSVAIFSLVLLAASSALTAQSSDSFAMATIADPGIEGGGGSLTNNNQINRAPSMGVRPFSRFAFSSGIGLMGINLQAATNVNRWLNVRGIGNTLNYTISNISTNGFNVGGNVNMATAGVSADIYPFFGHGLRISPGVMFRNTNAVSATFTAQPGTSFSLDNYTYYASASSPVVGVGSVNLHTRKPAYTATTGWGNIIPRNGGHISFPMEIGVAFIGTPVLSMALTSGQVCDAQGQNCVNVATDPTVQSNLQAQVVKYQKDLNPLKMYPIFNFGVSYNFRIR